MINEKAMIFPAVSVAITLPYLSNNICVELAAAFFPQIYSQFTSLRYIEDAIRRYINYKYYYWSCTFTSQLIVIPGMIYHRSAFYIKAINEVTLSEMQTFYILFWLAQQKLAGKQYKPTTVTLMKCSVQFLDILWMLYDSLTSLIKFFQFTIRPSNFMQLRSVWRRLQELVFAAT